jgi:hypothetical protein
MCFIEKSSSSFLGFRLPVLRYAPNRQPRYSFLRMNPKASCQIFAFHIKPVHDRMTTFLEPRDYAEYLTASERPPLHLLRILPADEMRAALVEKSNITNQQVSLFDSQ